MKRYTKTIDGNTVIKSHSEIVILGKKIIKDQKGKDREVTSQTFNPTEEQILADGWVEQIETEADILEKERVSNIRNAHHALDSGDYKVIKCMEAYLCGEDLPYDIHALHAERELQRKMINENEMDYVESNL